MSMNKAGEPPAFNTANAAQPLQTASPPAGQPLCPTDNAPDRYSELQFSVQHMSAVFPKIGRQYHGVVFRNCSSVVGCGFASGRVGFR